MPRGIFRTSFNSTLVQLKGEYLDFYFVPLRRFNSTLVQLKVVPVRVVFPVSSSFNSTLVQLKALAVFRKNSACCVSILP